MIKQHVFLSMFVYILVRVSLLFLLDGTQAINDIGTQGTLIIFTILTIVELIIISIPFIFKKLLKVLFDKKFKIYLYYLAMLLMHTLYFQFLAKSFDLVTVYLLELLLIFIISFIINTRSRLE